jgi:copper(I)-binding protein
MAMEGEVMKMRQVTNGIEIPAGQTVELKPGGLHLMFFKVSEPFQEGATVNVTLTFERAGAVDVALPVGPARGN